MGRHGDALSPKQRAFVREYLKDFNGTQAAVRAGYTAKTARTVAAQQLAKSNIQSALAEAMEALLAQEEITPERVLQEWKRLAYADMRRYATWDGAGVRLQPSTSLDDDAAAAVAEVSEETRVFGESTVRTVKFKLHSKTTALESLSRYLDLYHEMDKARVLGEGLASLLGEAHATAQQAAAQRASEQAD